MSAIWMPVSDFPGYEISSEGTIRSYRRPGGPWLMQSVPTADGYLKVTLRRDDGTQATRTVHILVARAFLGPCPVGYEVCHQDGTRTNNAMSNLRYGTKSENAMDRLKHGRDFQTSKTHCPAGHPYAGSNLTIRRDGARRCRTCHAAHERARSSRLARSA